MVVLVVVWNSLLGGAYEEAIPQEEPQRVRVDAEQPQQSQPKPQPEREVIRETVPAQNHLSPGRFAKPFPPPMKSRSPSRSLKTALRSPSKELPSVLRVLLSRKWLSVR